VIVDGGTFKLVKTIVYKGKKWGETKGDQADADRRKQKLVLRGCRRYLSLRWRQRRCPG